MRGPVSYVVRIYRRGFRSLGGVVEDTRSGRAHAFRNVEELLALLRMSLAPDAPSRRRAKPRSTR
jgi:hypothetical protein